MTDRNLKDFFDTRGGEQRNEKRKIPRAIKD